MMSVIPRRISHVCSRSLSTSACLNHAPMPMKDRKFFLKPPESYKKYKPDTKSHPDPTHTYTGVVESASDFQYVARLIPRKEIPPPPHKALTQYPTPSGWIPPGKIDPNCPYYVARTKWHNLPVFLNVWVPLGRKTTTIRHVQGDIWAMEKELYEYVLPHVFDGLLATQVSEVNRVIKVKGDWVEVVKMFLLEKGF